MALAQLKIIAAGQITGEGYGACSYRVYEACAPGQEDEEPLLLVWLHGADMGDISTQNLGAIHRRLRRRTFFFVPHNPRDSRGLQFFWAVAYTKAQNKTGLGFIYGAPHKAFMTDFCQAVLEVQQALAVRVVYIMGFSMGGYGVYHFCAHAPHLFDGAVAIAGYGRGTLDNDGNYKNAAQPEATELFEAWCAEICPKLAQVGALLVVHAPRDAESSFRDAQRIVEGVRKAGGVVQLVEVPDDMAESDPKSKKAKKSGHRYYHYTILNESSLSVLYDRLQALLDGKAPPMLPATTSNAAAEALAFSESFGIQQQVVLPTAGAEVPEVFLKPKPKVAASAAGHAAKGKRHTTSDTPGDDVPQPPSPSRRNLRSPSV